MKDKLNLLIAGAIATGVVGCKPYDGGTATVNPNPIEVRGDSVIFTTQLSLPADNYKKGTVLVAEAEFDDYEFPAQQINLDNFPDAATSGVNTTVTFRAPYVPAEMDGKPLEVETSFIMPNGKTKEGTETENIAECCVNTTGLFMINSEFMSTDLPDVEREPQKLVSQFNFPQDVYVLDQNAISNEDVAMIKNYLEDPKSAEKIQIHGYASPEGPYDRNEFLSRKRAEVVLDLLSSKLASQGYTGNLEDRVEIVVNQTIEDWDGFKTLVANHNYNNEDQVMIIANSSDAPDAKEAQIKEAVGGNIMALEPSLAPLRRTNVVIPCKVRCVSPNEVDSIAVAFMEGRANVTDLKEVYTQEQWLEAAQETDAAAGKKSLLVAYYDTYPTDYRVSNELGVNAILNHLEIKVEDDEMKIEGDGFEYKSEDDEWKLETADGLEIKVEDDEMKIDDGTSTAKFEDDEYTVKDEDYKLQVEDDELKLEDGDLQVKLEDDGAKLEDGNLKIKQSYNEDQLKIKDEGLTVKVDGTEMKVRENGTTLFFEDYTTDPVALQYLQRYDEAMKHFEEARSLKEDDNVVLSNIGAVYVAKNNLDEAQAYLTNSLEIKETPQAHYNLGVVLALKGNYGEALNHFDKAGDDSKFLYNRGLAKLLNGDHEGAAADMKQFINENPDVANAYYVMAILNARTANPDGVASNLRKAAAIDNTLASRAQNDFEFRNYDVNNIMNVADSE